MSSYGLQLTFEVMGWNSMYFHTYLSRSDSYRVKNYSRSKYKKPIFVRLLESRTCANDSKPHLIVISSATLLWFIFLALFSFQFYNYTPRSIKFRPIYNLRFVFGNVSIVEVSCSFSVKSPYNDFN